MSEIDVRLEHVSKEYRLSAVRGAKRFWALEDINLEVARGASLGVIGRNGAGKSTLLKLLAGITAPSAGRIILDGRVAALIEVGSGFHPELTGRENVFLSGALLGMRRREIAAKLESIVAFAGVQQFIDTPVKWYSSGMYVRLGFAVAAHMEPHILLVDEVLAVGDAEFQMKCLQRIQELTRQGTTSLFISHDLTAIERLCDSAVLLEHGRIAAAGAPDDVVASYHRRLTAEETVAGEPPLESLKTGIAFTNVTVHSPHEPRAVSFSTGAPLVVSLRYLATRTLANVEFELRYLSSDGKTRLASARTGDRGDALQVASPGGAVEFTCDALPLKPGAYYLGAVARDLATGKTLAWWDGETRLYVRSGPAVAGQFHIPHRWRVVDSDERELARPATISSNPAG
ncbi:MAG TPA: ABC transporter ATP-binding protein [Vicinamibacterales bacterium]|nr:ABC transporter ATP-binding protein [Vicinamibacterales bacterium]